jgi:hypothetical protein
MLHANTPQHTVSGASGSNRPPGIKVAIIIPNGLWRLSGGAVQPNAGNAAARSPSASRSASSSAIRPVPLST